MPAQVGNDVSKRGATNRDSSPEEKWMTKANEQHVQPWGQTRTTPLHHHHHHYHHRCLPSFTSAASTSATNRGDTMSSSSFSTFAAVAAPGSSSSSSYYAPTVTGTSSDSLHIDQPALGGGVALAAPLSARTFDHEALLPPPLVPAPPESVVSASTTATTMTTTMTDTTPVVEWQKEMRLRRMHELHDDILRNGPRNPIALARYAYRRMQLEVERSDDLLGDWDEPTAATALPGLQVAVTSSPLSSFSQREEAQEGEAGAGGSPRSDAATTVAPVSRTSSTIASAGESEFEADRDRDEQADDDNDDDVLQESDELIKLDDGDDESWSAGGVVDLKTEKSLLD